MTRLICDPRINAFAAVQSVDRVDQVVCRENCRMDCDVGYVFGGSQCDPVCGDRRIVDGEQCDRGGWCIGGSNQYALCLVNGPPICTGGVCEPRTLEGCLDTCLCDDSTNLCGDGNKCGSEQCDIGWHCGGDPNFNVDCTDNVSLCASCAIGDKVKLCDSSSTNKGVDCSSNPGICIGGACSVFAGYCTNSCTVNQP